MKTAVFFAVVAALLLSVSTKGAGVSHLWHLLNSKRFHLDEPLAIGNFENREAYKLEMEFEAKFSGPHVVSLSFGKQVVNASAKFDGAFDILLLSSGKELSRSQIRRWGPSGAWMDRTGARFNANYMRETVLCEHYLEKGTRYLLKFGVVEPDRQLDRAMAKVIVKYNTSK